MARPLGVAPLSLCGRPGPRPRSAGAQPPRNRTGPGRSHAAPVSYGMRTSAPTARRDPDPFRRRHRAPAASPPLAAGVLSAGAASAAPAEGESSTPTPPAPSRTATSSSSRTPPRAAARHRPRPWPRASAAPCTTSTAPPCAASPPTSPRRRAKRLAANPAVASVEQDRAVRRADRHQTDRATWGLDRIDQRALPLSGSYTYPTSAANVTAYILDTGVRLTHSEFGGRARSGYDFIDKDSDASDCQGHGTHVAGTVAGATYGVAKHAKIVAVRVLGLRRQRQLLGDHRRRRLGHQERRQAGRGQHEPRRRGQRLAGHRREELHRLRRHLRGGRRQRQQGRLHRLPGPHCPRRSPSAPPTPPTPAPRTPTTAPASTSSPPARTSSRRPRTATPAPAR